MIQKHCWECGAALIEKPLEGEAHRALSAPVCGEYRFPMYNAAVSMIVVDENTGRILLIQQYGRPSYILVAGYINRGERRGCRPARNPRGDRSARRPYPFQPHPVLRAVQHAHVQLHRLRPRRGAHSREPRGRPLPLVFPRQRRARISARTAFCRRFFWICGWMKTTCKFDKIDIPRRFVVEIFSV